MRCIKCSPGQRAGEFERPTVAEQLRYGGVIEVLRVQRAGFPQRLPHGDAWREYKNLDPSTSARLKPAGAAELKSALQNLLKVGGFWVLFFGFFRCIFFAFLLHVMCIVF